MVVNLRKAAEGQPCIMCGANDGSTVLHHLRLGNVGMGKKPADHYGIELCADCHRYVHNHGISDYKAMLIAHLRQVDRWIARGSITTGMKQ